MEHKEIVLNWKGRAGHINAEGRWKLCKHCNKPTELAIEKRILIRRIEIIDELINKLES